MAPLPIYAARFRLRASFDVASLPNAAAKAIAIQMEPGPSQNTVYGYIKNQYWKLAEEMSVPRSPTSSQRKG